MFCAMKRKHGKAKQWPVNAEIFIGEGEKFWKHVRDRGWTQDHVPIWCFDVIEARAKQNGGNYEKPPPGDFYPRTSSRSNPRENAEDALMCWSTCFTGLRYIDDGHTRGWSTKQESLTEVSHRDQIWSQTKCKKRARQIL